VTQSPAAAHLALANLLEGAIGAQTLLPSNWCGGATQLGRGLLFRPGVETVA
jgi:hypothetical protein